MSGSQMPIKRRWIAPPPSTRRVRLWCRTSSPSRRPKVRTDIDQTIPIVDRQDSAAQCRIADQAGNLHTFLPADLPQVECDRVDVGERPTGEVKLNGTDADGVAHAAAEPVRRRCNLAARSCQIERQRAERRAGVQQEVPEFLRVNPGPHKKKMSDLKRVSLSGSFWVREWQQLEQ